jgi:hypothetical protein
MSIVLTSQMAKLAEQVVSRASIGAKLPIFWAAAGGTQNNNNNTTNRSKS